MKSESVFASGARRAQGMEDRLPTAMDDTKPPWTICKAAMWDMESRLRRALGPNFDCLA
jgi:hypothetical protein